MTDRNTPPEEQRKRWMGILAQAPRDLLEAAWDDLDVQPSYEFLRRPEVGLTMVRGRAGGTGDRFNLGEMTMTRCVVRVPGGGTGYGFVAGRDTRHAELAAVFDALLCDSDRRAEIEARVVGPLSARLETARRDEAARTAATRVEFFTVVRGDD